MTAVPDGAGLDPLSAEYAAASDATVHLRLIEPETRIRIAACDDSLGQLWSGDVDEVTCPACVKAHADAGG